MNNNNKKMIAAKTYKFSVEHLLSGDDLINVLKKKLLNCVLWNF